MKRELSRRNVLWAGTGLGVGGVLFGGCGPGPVDSEGAGPVTPPGDDDEEWFRISLAQWSYFREHFGEGLQALRDPVEARQRLLEDTDSVMRGGLSTLDFPAKAREHGLSGVEFVNTFWFDKPRNQAFLNELAQRCRDAEVESLLIMCDFEGDLGHPDASERAIAARNHERWLEAAAFLGCHSIRVNAFSEGSYEEQQRLASDGLRQVCELADPMGLDVLVENHGGFSSNGQWLAGVMERVDHPRIGTLPDYGNFRVSEEPEEWYDRYVGVDELMPYAKAVSAKAYEFDEQGEDLRTDFARMTQILVDHGYRGWVGIEFEGMGLEADAGIGATRRLLERHRSAIRPV